MFVILSFGLYLVDNKQPLLEIKQRMVTLSRGLSVHTHTNRNSCKHAPEQRGIRMFIVIILQSPKTNEL